MILAEVSTLGKTMRKIYEGFATVHKSFIHLHGLQQKRKQFDKILKNIQVSIAYVQEWTMRYKGAPLELVKKMKPHEELEQAKVRMLIQKNKHLASFIGSIQDSYVWLFTILDVLVSVSVSICILPLGIKIFSLHFHFRGPILKFYIISLGHVKLIH